MNILILTIGTLGDVLPLIRLGQGLAEKQHKVSVASYEFYRQTVESSGLCFQSLPGNPEKVIQSKGSQQVYQAKSNPIKYFQALRTQANDVKAKARYFLDRCTMLGANADLIIYTLTTIVGDSVAEYHQIPSVAALLHPITPTADFPTFIVPKPSIGRWNKTSHYIMEQVMWQPYRGIVNGWRRSLGLSPLPFSGPFVTSRKRKKLVLYGFSEHIISKPKDWHDNIHVTGCWLPNEKHWQAPVALEEFIAAGEAPIYIGFGSVVKSSSKASIRLMQEALAVAGKRGIILNATASEEISTICPHIIQLKHVPHTYLFKQVSVAVHHGGAGTTAAALHAGIPSIIVPFMADGIFWGQQLYKLGLSPAPLSRNKVTAEALGQAIKVACDNLLIKQRSQDIAASLKKENGVARAVDIIQSLS